MDIQFALGAIHKLSRFSPQGFFVQSSAYIIFLWGELYILLSLRYF